MTRSVGAPKVLIVEDEALLAMAMALMLRRAGYEVCDQVGEGEAAIAKARAERPDAILFDIRLAGDLDGIQTARRIKEFSEAALIFMTGYDDPSYRKEAAELGSAGFLRKPITLAALDPILRRAAG